MYYFFIQSEKGLAKVELVGAKNDKEAVQAATYVLEEDILSSGLRVSANGFVKRHVYKDDKYLETVYVNWDSPEELIATHSGVMEDMLDEDVEVIPVILSDNEETEDLN